MVVIRNAFAQDGTPLTALYEHIMELPRPCTLEAAAAAAVVAVVVVEAAERGR
jgi:hypothetical protein